ncbi:phosphopantetheine-binding protein, partial [Pseudomonas putida]|uniref:phosphopantetheine-binding protein n=1 Tax=Pseudomonas putida TaxID=303 RepID=UPI001F5263FE
VVAGEAPADPQQQNALRSDLREHLRLGLADYMVPTHLLFLARLPVTANGKLDRNALPKPDASMLQDSYVAPRSELEQQIAAIWAEVLKLDQVGVTDNFFALGGHSLSATQVIVRVREATGIDATLKELFEQPRLEDFSGCLEQKNQRIDPIQAELAKSLEALKRLTTEEIDELIS